RRRRGNRSQALRSQHTGWNEIAENERSNLIPHIGEKKESRPLQADMDSLTLLELGRTSTNFRDLHFRKWLSMSVGSFIILLGFHFENANLISLSLFHHFSFDCIAQEWRTHFHRLAVFAHQKD